MTAAELSECGPGNRCAERSDHHRRDGTTGEFWRNELHGCKAVLLNERHVTADEKCGCTERDEVGCRDAPGNHECRGCCDECAADKRWLSTDALHE